MENINNYLLIIIILMFFYLMVMLYLKYGFKQAFTPVDSGIPAVESLPAQIPFLQQKNVYETEDTRAEYPLIPPVNPNARNAIISDVLPASPDLYTSQDYSSSDYILDTPPTLDTNQLNDNQMIKIPLQYNYPYNEQLRTQDILITPYNKVKYGTC